MEESLLTKCPFCRTLFRIRLAHLAAAEGDVRCGVCFKVFNAKQQGVSYSSGPGSDADTTWGRKPAAEESPAETESAVAAAAEAPSIAARTVVSAPPTEDELDQLQIETESIESLLYGEQRHSRAGPTVGWSALSLLGLLLLAAQWFWFNRLDYAYHPDWHAGYRLVCAHLPCNLPPYRAPERIKTERLEIKTHPDYSNVLVVDLILNNQGLLAQPLPALQLEFYDIDGQALAQRRFAPAEYLGTEYSAVLSLPLNRPVHFSFAILDPGQQAVNYAVSLHRPAG